MHRITGEAALSRGDLTDSEWRILDPLLPDRGDRGPTISGKRRMVNGILWVLHTGALARLLERYGNWNSVLCELQQARRVGRGIRNPGESCLETRSMPSIPPSSERTSMQLA
jgi:hypothetical protein